MDDERVSYNETIITKNGKKKMVKTLLYIPKDKNKIIEMVRKTGFKLDEIYNLKDVGNNDINLFIFHKV